MRRVSVLSGRGHRDRQALEALWFFNKAGLHIGMSAS